MGAIAAEYHETTTPLLGFLTRLCAIVGGLVAVAGLLDGVIYHGAKQLKAGIGKAS